MARPARRRRVGECMDWTAFDTLVNSTIVVRRWLTLSNRFLLFIGERKKATIQHTIRDTLPGGTALNYESKKARCLTILGLSLLGTLLPVRTASGQGCIVARSSGQPAG